MGTSNAGKALIDGPSCSHCVRPAGLPIQMRYTPSFARLGNYD